MIQFCFGSSSDYSAALRQLGGTRCFLRPVFRSHTRHLQDRHRKLSSAEAGPGLTSVEVWKVEVQKQNEDALDTIRSTYIVLLASLRRDTDATTRRRRVAGTSLDDVSRLYVL